MSRPKEVSFFQDTMDFKPNPNYEKGWEWYQQAFAHYTGEPVVGEATPSYSDRSRSPKTASRIAEFNPEMKIIYMVRDPLERQISAWKMQWAFGKEQSSPWRYEHRWAVKGFQYWMEQQREAGQWDICRYSYQLQAYRDHFPEEQILVSFLEDWREPASKALDLIRIMKFLGLDPGLWDAAAEVHANRGEERTIERPLLRWVRTTSIVRAMVSHFPLGTRNWAREHLAKKQAIPPTPSLTKQISSEFLNYVSPDILGSEPFADRCSQLWKSFKEQ